MKFPALVIGILLGCLFTTGWVLANEEEVSEQQLRQLRQDISELQGWLTQARDQQSDLQNQLRQTETQISQLVTRIEANTREAQELESRMQRLRREQEELQEQLDQQAGFLRQQIRAAYSMGRQEYLKVLLNQQEPDRVARLLRYYDYINRERTERIEDYLRIARQLDQVESEIVTRGQALEGVRRSLQERRRELLAEQQGRQVLIARLSQEISGRDDELQQLQADQERLQELLDAVTEAIVKLPPPRDARPFPDMRGNLPWPIQGRVLSAFGSRQQDNRLVSRGLTIQADSGAEIKAVHGGRIVFADWLRGFGFMVIIDHGGGYMSLYGHNQTLRRQTGDWVNAGDVIATAGSTGGQTRNALYFEIRHRGQPVDPITWIARR
ncbi:Septal ring factor EnvC, activator of murein hydrolases AmiA and AmiB [Marinospirillum celere]|uniref:Septal ring factor EnvC, activator of murein hydrolases AmiA and AmiB n=1 Tax=Marinospirillum celere TaxID=1122252 RepID=A0A1I1I7M5_9GAMM|nr:peptidoglycan DD-metalloendopeptidase family protein [Marinospirillum celere]SFC32419.1 Septal ring factor EnvC, activator of murein hydrolases AmiA and AmiB [Marinospirillum celere]